MLKKIALFITLLAAGIYNMADSLAPEVEFNYEEIRTVQRSMKCLAQVMYDEARGEPLDGKIAVAHVVINRTKTWNRDVCDVVYHKRGKTCQFSGMCSDNKRFTKETMNLAYDIIVKEKYQDNTNGATYFHATYVKPNWSKLYERTRKIGNHIFYVSGQTLR